MSLYRIIEIRTGVAGDLPPYIPVYIDNHCSEQIFVRTGFTADDFMEKLDAYIQKCPELGRLLSVAYKKRFDLERAGHSHLDIKFCGMMTPKLGVPTNCYLCLSFNNRGAAINTILMQPDIERGYQGKAEIAFFVHAGTLVYTVDEDFVLRKGMSNARTRNKIKDIRQV